MANYNIGIYIRLSQADLDLTRKEGKTESESISHQRDLINRYLDNSKELKDCRREEFFDDGYSGTNFNRPSFEKLIDKIKKREINLVAVKDFSRWGRDYIELGDYLERIFPFLGVRFISVNDNYDSNDYKGTTGGLDVVMKNIVYDYYSKDLSTKVLSAKRTKMKRGEYLGGHVPYGLKKCAEDIHKFEIDEEAGKIVRRIFDMALQGKTTAQIAVQLNDEGIPSPGEYYSIKNPDSRKFIATAVADKVSWSSTRVLNILHQEMYYGAVAQHKREVVSVGSSRTKQVPKEERIIVENMHPAIVTKEEWLKAQEVIRKVRSPRRDYEKTYPLKGVLRCGHCRRALQLCRRKKNPYFVCNSNLQVKDSPCNSLHIEKSMLENIVWESLQQMFSLADELSNDIRKQKAVITDSKETVRNQITDLQRRIEKLKIDKFSNVDKYMSGSMSKDAYLRERDELDKAIDSLDEQIKTLQKKMGSIVVTEDFTVDDVIQKMAKYSQETQLTNEMVRTFISAVYVTDKEHISLEWKFSDTFKSLLKM